VFGKDMGSGVKQVLMESLRKFEPGIWKGAKGKEHTYETTRHSCGKDVRDCCVWRLMKANVFGLFFPNFFVEGWRCEASSQTLSGAKLPQ
jgi:hypothetical protein